MKALDIISCYDQTAARYAEQFSDELTRKPMDRVVLRAFCRHHMQSGLMIDLGCGPGQTTAFLRACGKSDIVGIDISPMMIDEARARHPEVDFQTGDMRHMAFEEQSIGSAVAMYAIVHFEADDLRAAFQEVARVLQRGGQFLLSFHVGSEVICLEEFLGVPVRVDFHFFETKTIREYLMEAGFQTLVCVDRDPYPGAEYPSKRAYLWSRKL